MAVIENTSELGYPFGRHSRQASAAGGSRAGRKTALPASPDRQRMSVLATVSLMAVTAVGMFLTAFLAWIGFTSSRIPGCGSGHLFDCDHVLQTRWSSLAGIPVGALAAGLYLALFVSLVVHLASGRAAVRRWALSVVAVATMSAGLAGVWFVSLQFFVVEHLCAYCLAAHACGFALAWMAFRFIPLEREHRKRLAAVSVLGVSVLAAGQLMAGPSATFRVEHHKTETAVSGDRHGADVPGFQEEFSAPGAGRADSEVQPKMPVLFEAPGRSSEGPRKNPDRASGAVQGREMLAVSMAEWTLLAHAAVLFPAVSRQESGQARAVQNQDSGAAKEQSRNPADSGQDPDEAVKRRMVGIFGGKIQLDVDQWPLLGNRNAQCIFVEMSDYTCPHCRANHQFISQARAELGDGVAVLVFSVPINRNCNDTVQHTEPVHADACELARLALAVWRLAPEKFPAFHEWLFSGEAAPTARSARIEAESLVDSEKLAEELGGETVDLYIAKQVELYRMVGAGTVPKMLFPDVTVTGNAGSAESLVRIIEQQRGGGGESPPAPGIDRK